MRYYVEWRLHNEMVNRTKEALHEEDAKLFQYLLLNQYQIKEVELVPATS